MKVAVLGAGPAGLLAVHGALLAGAEVVNIYSTPTPSVIRGAQYLHDLPPGLAERAEAGVIGSAQITYRTIGTAQEYRDKVYGRDTLGAQLVSPAVLSPYHYGYNIRQVYGILWEMYHSYIIPLIVDAPGLGKLLAESPYDLIVSTVPKSALCKVAHQFAAADINVAEVAFVKGQDIVVCDGRPGGDGPSWYRSSRIFGVEMTEWPGSVHPPIPGIAAVRKPIHNTCDCWDATGRVMFAGRYGRWEKGVLAHHAFNEVHERVSGA